MHQRRIPEWLRHRPHPGVRGFATLAGIEAVARGILISVFPLVMYRTLQDAKVVSEVYFVIGFLSLFTGLMVPLATRIIPRRFVYVSGNLMYATGALLAVQGTPWAVITGLLLTTMATVTTFVCFNAYVLDFISKVELGRCESSRMLYSALGWTIGPALGVALFAWSPPLPFYIAAGAAMAMMVTFLFLRLGNGRLITRARKPAPNPFAYLPRFAAQPRLVAGWTFAVIRSCGWWVYIVYLPIFAIERGLNDQIGGFALSISNGFLFLAPLMSAWMRRNSIRLAVRTGFACACALFVAGTALSMLPVVTVVCLMAASFFLILLDVAGGLPFLMAVKPSERTEMSAIYSSYRDVSGIMTPGVAWLVLLVAPVPAIFAACGAAMFGAWILSGNVHPRLGAGRIKDMPRRESVSEGVAG